MITFVLGPSGSGKTRWLIEQANAEKKRGNGNIAFIDSDDSHIFSLDHGVRLINAADYGISNVDQFYGFVSGIVSRDYDLEKIYVDGIYEIVNVYDGLEVIVDKLSRVTDSNNVEILIGLDKKKEDLPKRENVKVVELSEEK